ncbi:hypothetical protein PROFUN_13117 [Planoprotostelium fungivorum]|uniref:Uncharacterized protein n=1 Tax=Planoprotostelium fungivorum TaxID=1890364 RepID=A0A2P6N5E6_9EUKA|nr:hypothetical protein PROFUN_13117 [Planoprotostelium fungivorum]
MDAKRSTKNGRLNDIRCSFWFVSRELACLTERREAESAFFLTLDPLAFDVISSADVATSSISFQENAFILNMETIPLSSIHLSKQNAVGYLSCRDVTELTLNMLLNGTPKPREHGGPRPTQQQTAHLRSVRAVCKTWMEMVDRIFTFQSCHLLLAIHRMCNESVRFLIQRVSIDRHKWNAAMSLAINRETYDIIQYLLKHTHYTPQLDHLFQACQKGNVQLFQLVRQAGPPFHTIQRQMWINCLVKQHKDLLRHLIEHPQLPFKQTDSAALCEILSHAVTHNSIDMLEFLLDLSTSNELLGGHSLALKTASWQGSIDKMKLLLRHPRTDATQHPQCLFTRHVPSFELLLEDEKMVPVMFELFREGVTRWVSGRAPRRHYVAELPILLKEIAHLRKLKNIICEVDHRRILIYILNRIDARINELEKR